MKQHITPKQLNELSEKGREKLRKWWKPKLGDRFVLGESHYRKDRQKIEVFTRITRNDSFLSEYTPLLSIGQMVEFLDEYTENHPDVDKNFVVTRYYHQIKENWGVQIDDLEIVNEVELCDALWKPVREILEK